MSKEFPCKEPGCTQTVVYEPDPIPAYAKEVKIVYLTCSNGHTYAYEV